MSVNTQIRKDVSIISNIVLYSTGCPKCEVLKKKLAEKGIQYKVNESVEEMLSLGIEQVPVLKINEKLLSFSAAVKWINDKN